MHSALDSARVLVVGAGGLGSAALYYLAAAGIGTLGIADDDEVDFPNLNRQILYDEHMIGLPKVDAAKARLSRFNSRIIIHTHDTRITSANAESFIFGYHVVIDCADNLKTTYVLNEACVRLRKPFVYGGIRNWSGQCALFSHQAALCFECLFPRAQKSALPGCRHNATLGVVVGLLGTLQATLALQWLLGNPINSHQFFQLDLNPLGVTRHPLTPNRHCPICAKYA